MKVLDPLGEMAQAPRGRTMRELESLEHQRVGLIWGQHAASVKFWPVFEDVALETFRPSAVYRHYKSSSWNPAAPEDVAKIAQEIDFALIGVGA